MIVRVLLWAVLFAGVAAGAWAVVNTYNTKIAEAAELAAQRDAEKVAAQGWMASAMFWKAEKEKQDRALAARDRSFAVISSEARRLHEELELAKRTDQTLKAWTDAPLPAFVVKQLRSLSADPGSSDRPEGRNTGKPHGGDSRSALAGLDKR